MLNIRKETGWTSHDVVARVRRLSGQKRVGHAGTLDPLAEGVLPVLLGRATRLVDALQGESKLYQAAIALGTETTTDDAEGEITRTSAVPALDAARVEEDLCQFEGEIKQVPPVYSAIKVGGKTAYARTRKGETLALPPRVVHVEEVRLMALGVDQLVVDVRCGRGTYVRSLARDIGASLGTAAHLAHLVRLQVGPFRLADAVTLQQVEADGVAAHLLPCEVAVAHLPPVRLRAEDARALRQGQRVLFSPCSEADFVSGVEVPALSQSPAEVPDVRVYDEGGEMIALATIQSGYLRPRVVLEPA